MRYLKLALLAVLAFLVIPGVIWFHPGLEIQEIESKYANDQSQFVMAAGARIHYRDEGTGPTLLLIHGTAASLHTWDSWTQLLKSKYRVVRLDLPAFGLTGTNTSGDYSVDQYVKTMHAFSQKLNLEPFAVAGNSLGGLVAWRYAAAYPRDVSALILIDAAGYPMDSVPLLILLGRMPIVGDLTPWITPYGVVENQVRNVYGDPSRIKPGVVQRYYELLLRKGNRQAYRSYTRTLRADDSWRQISSITAPTLIQWGTEDRLIPLSMAQQFASDISHSVVIEYKGAGHIPMEEIPEVSASDADRFLQTLTPKR